MTKPLLFALCLLLAGCPASSPPEASTGGADAPAKAAPAPQAPQGSGHDAAPAPAAPVVTPVPGDATPAPAAPAAGEPSAARRPPDDLLTQDGVHYGCNTDRDCAVKDVGNCCGYYPACVNKDSPTFPDKVKAACSAEGRSAICGFPEIAGCQCVEGRCAPQGGPTGALQQE